MGPLTRARIETFGTCFFENDGEELWSVRTSSLDEGAEVVRACAAIEERAWRPREPFTRALRRSEQLLWSTTNGAVNGFVLASVLPAREGELAISIDEAMVDSEHVGQHVVSRIFWSAACGVTALAAQRRASRVVFFALTSSPRLIGAFYKYRALLPEHSFAPSAWIEDAAKQDLARRGLEPFEGTSVWAKAAFPRGLSEREPDVLGVPTPSGFDARGRGDALLMIGAIPTAVARPIVLARHAMAARSTRGRQILLPW